MKVDVIQSNPMQPSFSARFSSNNVLEEIMKCAYDNKGEYSLLNEELEAAWKNFHRKHKSHKLIADSFVANQETQKYNILVKNPKTERYHVFKINMGGIDHNTLSLTEFLEKVTNYKKLYRK